ncbi:1-phosphofructokinase family hexose kinase [Gymnodinialimonas sp.]
MAIVTLTLNPALDLETAVAHVRPRDKLRCSEPRSDPGGGGINVARAIKTLGGSARAAIALGGATGAVIAASLQDAQIDFLTLTAPGPTRQNLSVIDAASAEQFRFIFPGPTWTLDDLAAVAAPLSGAVGAGDILVLSGSLPPGLAPEALVNLAQSHVMRGVRVVVDTSGAPLIAMARSARGLCLLRMDDGEAEELFARTLPQAADSADAAQALVRDGVAEAVIIARGTEGSVLATAKRRWFAPAADVPVASLTGAGDSFVAAATLAIAQEGTWPEVLSAGCAAASSAVTTPATALCDPDVYATLLPGAGARRI